MNHAPTDIQLSNTTILDSEIFKLIGTLTTSDPDAGDTFTYAISQVWDGYGYYSLEQGDNLYVYGGTSPGTYPVWVRATDQGGLSVEKILTFSILPDYKYFTGTNSDDVIDVPQYTRHAIIDGGTGTDTVIAHSGFYAEQMTNVEILDVQDQGSGITLTQAQFDSLTQITSTSNEQILVSINDYSSVDFSAKLAAGHSVDASLVGAGTATGTDGDDSIWAMAGGNAVLYGGAGNDTLVADRGATIVISGDDGNDVIWLGSNGLYTGTSSVTLSGGAGDDSFTIANGLLTQGTVDGGAGHDRVAASLGDLTFVAVEEWQIGYHPLSFATGTIAQVASFSEITSQDSGVSIALRGAGGTLDLSAKLAANLFLVLNAADLTSGIDIIGSQVATNWIDGSGFADHLTGGAAKDYLKGGAGDDTVDGGLGDDDLRGGAGADTLNGGGGNDTLNGEAGEDTLNGGEGSDLLNGGLGADTLAGGLGDDHYIVDNALDVVQEAAGEGTDTIESSISYELSATLENLTLTGSAAINATGNDLDNVISGNQFANIIRGGAGSDTLSGGNGGSKDQLFGEAGDDAFITVGGEAVDGGTGIDSMLISGSGSLVGCTFTNVERLDFTDVYASAALEISQFSSFTDIRSTASMVYFNLFGQGGAADLNTLLGKTYSATIDGSSLIFGMDLVLGSGNDIVSGTYWADSIFGGAGGDRLYGMYGNDLIFGGWGNDAINSGPGSSKLYGGDGNDIISVGSQGSQLFGGNGNDKLSGEYGNDYLNGGTGDDTMSGGDLDDIYIIDSVHDAVIETNADKASGGTDRVIASVSYALSANVEGLRLTGNAAINGTGNILDNQVSGNDGINILDGRAGNDLLIGGTGKDTFLFSAQLSAITNVDFIGDFSAADDTIRLENTGTGRFNALALGTLGTGAFYAAAGAVRAHDASDRIVYNTANGAIYYDADGAGGAEAIRFATLKAAPTLTNADFVVV